MFTVTETALDRLTQKLVGKNAAVEMALRVLERKGIWRLRVDRPQPEDTVFAHHGREVLLMDKTVAQSLANNTLDTRSTPKGPRLTLR
jgi:hypothetical protein